MKLAALIFSALLLTSPSCTDNSSARRFGGKTVINLPAKTKLMNAAWKENSLWYLHRPAQPGELPATIYFQEKSSLGLVEGTVIFQEF